MLSRIVLFFRERVYQVDSRLQHHTNLTNTSRLTTARGQPPDEVNSIHLISASATPRSHHVASLSHNWPTCAALIAGGRWPQEYQEYRAPATCRIMSITPFRIALLPRLPLSHQPPVPLVHPNSHTNSHTSNTDNTSGRRAREAEAF